MKRDPQANVKNDAGIQEYVLLQEPDAHRLKIEFEAETAEALQYHAGSTERTDTSVALSSKPKVGHLRLLHPTVWQRQRSMYLATKQWEGTVLDVGDGEFTARLRDVGKAGEPEIRATLLIDESVSDSDMPLLRVGAVFYWSMSTRVFPWGQRKQESTFLFRRLPTWSPSVLEQGEKFAREFSAFLDDDQH